MLALVTALWFLVGPAFTKKGPDGLMFCSNRKPPNSVGELEFSHDEGFLS